MSSDKKALFGISFAMKLENDDIVQLWNADDDSDVTVTPDVPVGMCVCCIPT